MTGTKRIVVVEVEGGVADVSYRPPDVDVTIYDHDDAKEEGVRREERELSASERGARAREHARGILDEQAAIDLLRDCWARFEREDDRKMMARISEVLDPVVGSGSAASDRRNA